MLRKLLEAHTGPMPYAEYRLVLNLVATDIRTNRVAFGRRTSLSEAIEIAVICRAILRRVPDAA